MSSLAIAGLLIMVLVLGFWLGANSDELTNIVKSKCRPIIRIKRYTVGTEKYNFFAFKIKEDSKLLQENDTIYEIAFQVDQMNEYVQKIVGLVIAYDLEDFHTIAQKATITTNIEAMANNIDKFINFLKQPEIIVSTNCKKAVEETVLANQPILDNLKTIQEAAIKQANDSKRHLIDFNHNEG